MSITYEDYYNLAMPMLEELEKYVVKYDRCDATFHRARNILMDMSHRSFRDRLYMLKVYKWLKSKSTVDLKDALYPLGYSNEDILQFNAFALLDTVIIKI